MTDNSYRFRASKSQTNFRLANLPKHQLQAFMITINGKPTDQSLDRVSFKLNDVIEIQRVDGGRDYPLLNFQRDFVKVLLTPLPRLGNIRSLRGLFESCKTLQRVPRDMFVNNPNVTDYTDAFKGCELHHLGSALFNTVKIRVGLLIAPNFHKDAAFGDFQHDVSSLGVLSNNARWTCFSRVPGNMFTARVGKAHRRGSEREGGIIHDGARSGTRERGSEYGEAARSCTSGRGTGDAGPAGMMRGYAPPPPLPPERSEGMNY